MIFSLVTFSVAFSLIYYLFKELHELKLLCNKNDVRIEMLKHSISLESKNIQSLTFNQLALKQKLEKITKE